MSYQELHLVKLVLDACENLATIIYRLLCLINRIDWRYFPGRKYDVFPVWFKNVKCLSQREWLMRNERLNLEKWSCRSWTRSSYSIRRMATVIAIWKRTSWFDFTLVCLLDDYFYKHTLQWSRTNKIHGSLSISRCLPFP